MPTRLTPWMYAATIFVSAFLLFQIQPLISRCLLPWFGGTPNVWTTCLLFFQTVLFGGYVYAHLLSRCVPAHQALVHLGLLGVAVAGLQILPPGESRPDPQGSPVAQILLLLTASVGLPYFVLSTTGPLLQSWFSRALPGRSPYRLYALSNAGSLLALVSYPFVVEPVLGMTSQAAWWSSGFLLFALLCGGCAWIVSRTAGDHPGGLEIPSDHHAGPESEERPGVGRVLSWFALSMTASVLLLATTNQVCLDVAVVPFLWVVPLGLYLLSFILCFDGDRWYSRTFCGLAGAAAMVLTAGLLLQNSATSLVVQVSVAFAAMFLGCMLCHGELVRLRPGPRRLTAFYLVVSAGGAAGGLFVSVIAPLVFPLYLEMHLSIAVTCGLALWVYLREKYARDGRPEWLLRGGAIATLAALIIALQAQATATLAHSAAVRRNFYGVLRVEHQDAGEPERHTLQLRYGRILHGLQYAAPHKQRLATTYYGPLSGVGRLIADLQDERPRLRIGVVGLGVGTLATYGRPGDLLRFYEINPDVTRLAHEHFTYLRDAPAQVEIVPGDARLTLEREQDAPFDLLVLDAFSGDAVPAHLLTREALQVYLRRLRPEGLLAFHISNLHFDLRPVVASLADDAGLAFRILIAAGDHATGQTGSVWFAAAKDPALLESARVNALASPPPSTRVIWTDDYSDLFSLLK